jgi:ribosomal protein S8
MKIRNPNIEIRNNFQISNEIMTETHSRLKQLCFIILAIRTFGFVSDFEFRASDLT